ncbi:MAG: ferrous iron transport protein A [Coriobacteriia bacterium]|nr:ferrous iron transport protein A [Coriobacteriia bacterium]
MPGRGHGRGRRQWMRRTPLREGEVTLDQTFPGDEFEILEIGDERARMHALRFGMAEGAHVSCVTRVPAGPIVLRSGRQEIAVGRHLARRIRVRRLGQDVA